MILSIKEYLLDAKHSGGILLMAALLLIVSTVNAQWSQMPGTAAGQVRALVVDGKSTIACVGASLYRSFDNGATWSKRVFSLSSNSVGRAMFEWKGVVYFGMSPQGVFRSTAEDTVWALMVSDPPANQGALCFMERAGRLFAGTFGSLRELQDTVWRYAGNGFYKMIFSLAHDDANIYAGTDDNGLYRSSDDGITWVHAADVPTSTIPRGILCIAPYVLVGFDRLPLYRSSDHGIMWQAIEVDSNHPHSLCFASSHSAIFAGTDQGVFRSIDYGLNWEDVSQGMPDSLRPIVAALVIHSDTLYAGTNQWIWRRPLSELLPPSGVESASAGTRTTTLGQSIPNPASSDVIIPYSLAASGHVTLKLYNSLLQEVETLANREEEQGWHQARLDAANLTSGTYYYRLVAGNSVQTRQMVIVR